MNRKQKMCLLVGITAIVVMGLFPPWVLERRVGKTKYIIEPGPYSWIGSPPVRAAETIKRLNSNYPRYSSEKWLTTTIRYEARAKFVDLYRLGVQYFVVAVITAGLIIILGNKKTKKEDTDKNSITRGLFFFTLVSFLAVGFIIPAIIIFVFIAIEGWDDDMVGIWFIGLYFSAGIWILYGIIRGVIIPISRWAAKSFRDV